MGMSSDSKQYMEKLTNTCGHIYDFSKSVYINNRTPMIVICKICQSESERIPWNILKSKSCKMCHSAKRTSNSEEFIRKAKEIHGEKYCYEDIFYTNAKPIGNHLLFLSFMINI